MINVICNVIQSMPGIQALCVLFGFVLGINMAKAGLLFSKRDKIVLDCPEEWAQGKCQSPPPSSINFLFVFLLFSSLYLSLFSSFIFFIFFPPLLLPSRLALFTPGFPFLHYFFSLSPPIKTYSLYSLHLVDPSATSDLSLLILPDQFRLIS